jgi:hypothetical protein
MDGMALGAVGGGKRGREETTNSLIHQAETFIGDGGCLVFQKSHLGQGSPTLGSCLFLGPQMSLYRGNQSVSGSQRLTHNNQTHKVTQQVQIPIPIRESSFMKRDWQGQRE